MSQIQNNFSPKAQGERARKKEETKSLNSHVSNPQ